MAEDRRAVGPETSIRAALTDRRVLALVLVLFGILYSTLRARVLPAAGCERFQREFRTTYSLVEIGLITAVPYAFAAAAMVVWATHSDRTGERPWHVAGPLSLVRLR